MEAGRLGDRALDLIDIMIDAADDSVDDDTVTKLEQRGCPTCGSCSGMFTANSMNSLNEAIGLALPGNGTIVATHANRTELFKKAAQQIVKNTFAYYYDDDESVLPRNIATRQAMLNAMTLDIAMGGSTNTVLHLLAIAHEAEAQFNMDDIDALSRKTPVLCKVAPNSKYHIQDVNRAGGIISIMKVLADEGIIDTTVKRVDGLTLGDAIENMLSVAKISMPKLMLCGKAHLAKRKTLFSVRKTACMKLLIPTEKKVVFATLSTHTLKTEDLQCSVATSRLTVA